MEDETEVLSSNFRIDLMSNLFGQKIASGILKDDQNPTIDNTKQRCPQAVFLRNVCTQCGIENNGEIHTVPYWYVYPNLSLNFNEINRFRDENLQKLLSRRKLHLVIDLDHALIHKRTSYKLSPEGRKFLGSKRHGIEYNLAESGSLFKVSDGWIKLRPYVQTFLEEASKMFDMTIYTLSGRLNAWTVAKMLDPNGVYFDMWRVISRDDCVAIDKHTKCLDVILEHEKVIVVLDDSETVWNDYKSNFLKVTPYNFFSFFSPENKEHDASPPRLSWSQLNADESEDNGVLAKVLAKLRMIHAAFYDDDGVKGVQDYANRDVRHVLQKIHMIDQRSSDKKQINSQKAKKVGKLLSQSRKAMRR